MPISLGISNTVTDCDKGYIELSCAVDRESILDIFSIQMKRFDGDDASVVMEIGTLNVEQEHVVLVDTELASRTGVVVNSSISTAGVSYLSLRIMGSVVKPQKDKGPYQCFLFGLDTFCGSIKESSTLEMLNITGNSNIILRLDEPFLKRQSKELDCKKRLKYMVCNIFNISGYIRLNELLNIKILRSTSVCQTRGIFMDTFVNFFLKIL